MAVETGYVFCSVLSTILSGGFLHNPLPVYLPDPRPSDKLIVREGKYGSTSLIMTGAVILGSGLVIFGVLRRGSFEMFWLDLVIVPLLGKVVLPLCLLVLCARIL